jgi:hypothetical protein
MNNFKMELYGVAEYTKDLSLCMRSRRLRNGTTAALILNNLDLDEGEYSD